VYEFLEKHSLKFALPLCGFLLSFIDDFCRFSDVQVTIHGIETKSWLWELGKGPTVFSAQDHSPSQAITLKFESEQESEGSYSDSDAWGVDTLLHKLHGLKLAALESNFSNNFGGPPATARRF